MNDTCKCVIRKLTQYWIRKNRCPYCKKPLNKKNEHTGRKNKKRTAFS